MKVQFEGEPSEIIALFEHFQATKAALESSTALSLVAPRVVEEAEPAPAPVAAEVEPLRVVSAQKIAKPKDERPNRQAPLKDRIVQFLEGRSTTAKTRDISNALNWHSRSITPRLSELVLEGRVERIVRPDGNEFKMRGAPVVAPEPVTEPKAAAKKAKSKKLSDGKAIKELIVEYLSENPNSTATDIRLALGETKSSTVSSRLFYLCKDGVVQKIDREKDHAIYTLANREESPEPKVSVVDESKPVPEAQKPIDPIQIEYLRIMAALVTERDATYFDLERITKIPRGILSSRLLDMERLQLVARGGGGRTGPVNFNPKAPNANNEMPLPYNSLEEAIVECLKQYEGASAEQVSMLLLKSFDDVQRKLKSMIGIGSKLMLRGEKYYVR